VPGTVGGVGTYDWDPDKAEVTRRRRGITFDEAEAVVLDPASVTRFDFAHSADEPRFITVGLSTRGRVLVVITSERGPRPRIISARRATKRERDAYLRRR